MQRAVTVMCIRSSVPGLGGWSPGETVLDRFGEVGLHLTDVPHDPAGVEFLGAQRRDLGDGPVVIRGRHDRRLH